MVLGQALELADAVARLGQFSLQQRIQLTGGYIQPERLFVVGYAGHTLVIGNLIAPAQR
jgi:hypothetical protein